MNIEQSAGQTDISFSRIIVVPIPRAKNLRKKSCLLFPTWDFFVISWVHYKPIPGEKPFEFTCSGIFAKLTVLDNRLICLVGKETVKDVSVIH